MRLARTQRARARAHALRVLEQQREEHGLGLGGRRAHGAALEKDDALGVREVHARRLLRRAARAREQRARERWPAAARIPWAAAWPARRAACRAAPSTAARACWSLRARSRGVRRRPLTRTAPPSPAPPPHRSAPTAGPLAHGPLPSRVHGHTLQLFSVFAFPCASDFSGALIAMLRALFNSAAKRDASPTVERLHVPRTRADRFAVLWIAEHESIDQTRAHAWARACNI